MEKFLIRLKDKERANVDKSIGEKCLEENIGDSERGVGAAVKAAFKSVGALGPDLIWATLVTPKKFCHVYSTQHPVSMNFYGHGRKVSL